MRSVTGHLDPQAHAQKLCLGVPATLLFSSKCKSHYVIKSHWKRIPRTDNFSKESATNAEENFSVRELSCITPDHKTRDNWDQPRLCFS